MLARVSKMQAAQVNKRAFRMPKLRPRGRFDLAVLRQIRAVRRADIETLVFQIDKERPARQLLALQHLPARIPAGENLFRSADQKMIVVVGMSEVLRPANESMRPRRAENAVRSRLALPILNPIRAGQNHICADGRDEDNRLLRRTVLFDDDALAVHAVMNANTVSPGSATLAAWAIVFSEPIPAVPGLASDACSKRASTWISAASAVRKVKANRPWRTCVFKGLTRSLNGCACCVLGCCFYTDACILAFEIANERWTRAGHWGFQFHARPNPGLRASHLALGYIISPRWG